jgi:serine/threonine protein kinase
MPWQFLVVDGANKGQIFPLPEKGVVVIGSSQKDADIWLHDLYVQRAHCEAEIDPDGGVQVRNLRPQEGIQVNKVRTEEQQLHPGDVLRVGNSHLRLELAAEAGPPPAARAAGESDPATAGPPPALPPERLDELTGHVLGHYQLGNLLGKSGHTAVFLARDCKTNEETAVKVLSPLFPAGQDESRLFVETLRQAVPLQHESLVALRGAGRTGPYTWIAREYVPGESLADLLERIAAGSAKPKWQSALRLARQIGSVLDYLHQRRVMHGWLTPSNVLLNTEAKQAKLANLMLDKALAGSRLFEALWMGRFPRDVAYLSPEQCDPEAFIDEMSDQYTLGALVYARMTGQPPFVGTTPEETVELIRTAPLVRPRHRDPAIPARAEAVVVQMLSRHQEDRYPNPAALLLDLEKIAK